MHEQIELFADTLLMLLTAAVASVLIRFDPLLPPMWLAATMLMTRQRH